MSADLGHSPALHIDGAVATITLRRPAQANRLEVQDLALIEQQIEQVNADASVRVLCLTATGSTFCSGFNTGRLADRSALKKAAPSDAVPSAGSVFEVCAQALENARPLTVAGINGGLYGGATDLALACDFRIAVQSSKLFVPAAEIGLHFYGSGLGRYVSRLGLNMAKRVLLGGERLDAQQMLACGFVDQLVADPAELATALAERASHLASLAPLAVQGMKRHLNALARGTLDEAVLRQDVQRANNSEDFLEGIQAKAEKRVAVFKGR